VPWSAETPALRRHNRRHERALLRNTKRSATVTACTRSRLLVPDASDLKTLISREPHIADHLDKIVSRRSGYDDGAAANINQV
jgi:CRP-like cAMP-binding protein